MAGTQSRRKPINLAILNILRTHSTVDHPMRIKAIQEKLLEFDLTPTRKSITNNISDLQQAGYPLRFSHGWYYDHEFTAEELNFLIDEVHCAGQLNVETRTVIIDKLKRLGGIHFTPSCESVPTKLINPSFLFNLNLLHNAIRHRSGSRAAQRSAPGALRASWRLAGDSAGNEGRRGMRTDGRRAARVASGGNAASFGLYDPL